MKTDLTNKIAFVSGGTDKVGTAICKQLASSGATVITECQDDDIAKKWQSEIETAGFNIGIYKADITDFTRCGKLIETIINKYGAIDIVINNAEMKDTSSFRKMTIEQWNNVLKNNLDSVFNVCRHTTMSMVERGFGRIINISSVKSRKGVCNESHYSASKSGMHGFTMALAQEVGSKGVTVNTVSPGYMENGKMDKTGHTLIPAGRLGDASEVAYLVDFLCSDYAAYINGSDIAVNGGCYLH